MTQNVENFMNYLFKTIKDLSNDEAVMKKIFKEISFDDGLDIESTSSDSYEIDDNITEILGYMGLYSNDGMEGILPYDNACDEYNNQCDYLEDDSNDWEDNQNWSPSNETDFVYFVSGGSVSCNFDADIDWSFSLKDLLEADSITTEDIEALKEKYGVEHT